LRSLPGSVHRAIARVAARLQAPVQAIRGALVPAAVAHADGIGLGVSGGLYWLQVLSTA
jgi:hypothetical protein